MLSSMVRTQKTRQIGMVQTMHLISGTAATPADSGIDKAFVLSVTDNGVGSWTITFKEAARQNLHVVGCVSATADSIMAVTAVTSTSVTVTAVNGAGAAKDANFFLTVQRATQIGYNF